MYGPCEKHGSPKSAYLPQALPRSEGPQRDISQNSNQLTESEIEALRKDAADARQIIRAMIRK